MGQTNDPVYVTPRPESETTVDPFGWGSRYDVTAPPPTPPTPSLPPASSEVKSRNGTFYGRAEAMVFRREPTRSGNPIIINIDPNVPLDPQGFPTVVGTVTTSDLTNFPFILGHRGTLGYQFNRGPSIEFTYFAVQSFQISRDPAITGDNSLFLTSDGRSPSDLSLISTDYNAAESMSIFGASQFKSIEVNVMNPTIYERLQVLVGFRAVDFDDSLDIRSTNVDTQSTSDYIGTSSNFLRGGQFGGVYKRDFDLFGLEFYGKAGIYNDHSRYAVRVGDQNNTPPLLRDASGGVDSIAYLFDLNLTGTYRLGGHLLLRCGYSTIWMNQVSLATNYLDFTIDSSANSRASHSGYVLFHGLNAGLEAQF